MQHTHTHKTIQHQFETTETLRVSFRIGLITVILQPIPRFSQTALHHLLCPPLTIPFPPTTTHYRRLPSNSKV